MGASPLAGMRHIAIRSAAAAGSGLRLAAVYAPIWGPSLRMGRGVAGLGISNCCLANGRPKIDLMFAALIVLACLTVAFASGCGKSLRIGLVTLCARRLKQLLQRLAVYLDAWRGPSGTRRYALTLEISSCAAAFVQAFGTPRPPAITRQGAPRTDIKRALAAPGQDRAATSTETK